MESIRPLIRRFDDRDADAVVGLSLRAWEPIFSSVERVIGSGIYGQLYPDGWRETQRQAVQAACASQGERVWVAEVDGAAVGFVAIELHPESGIGEIHMLAVDPDHQGGGIGTALTGFALAHQRRRDGGRDGRDGGRPRARRGASCVREGRLRPLADSQVLQGAVAEPWGTTRVRSEALQRALFPLHEARG